VAFLDNPHTVLAHVAQLEEEAAPAAEGADAKAPEVIGEKEREAKLAAKDGKPGAAPAKADAKPAAAAKPAGKK
jgi:hypothetical protein